MHLHVPKQVALPVGLVVAEDASEARFSSTFHISMILKRTPASVGLAAGHTVVSGEGRRQAASAVIICGNTRETRYA